MRSYLLIALFLLISFSGCKKDKETTPTPEQNLLTLQISHVVDAVPLDFDTLLYTNEASYSYSVSRIWYYISNVRLIKADSSEVKVLNYAFIDASRPATGSIKINAVPEGSYIGLAYCIGLDSVLNQTGALPVNTDNLNMEWPVPMGGGYHFLKFEGHFIDSSNTYGFAMHIGTNAYLVNGKAWSAFSIGSGTNQLNMDMNMNEWFRTPAVYDFNTDGNYSMSSMMAMNKLMMNGADVFTLH